MGRQSELSAKISSVGVDQFGGAAACFYVMSIIDLGAMAAAFHELKLVVEPGGAAALAAVLNGALETTDKTVVVVASGGNVDPDVFRMALDRGADHA